MECNILLVDKPTGVTSFDVIRILRKRLGVRKMGHAGTLDPLASGLLLVAVGDATKKLTSLLKLPKEYEATVRLGIRTDSGDVTGSIIREGLVPELDPDGIRRVIQGMVGTLQLPVPAFSAVKVGGRRLYAQARKGRRIDPPIRSMQVTEAALLAVQRRDLRVRWTVGSGTYVRSLAEELGRRLGTVATIAALRRTRVGPYGVDDAAPPKHFGTLSE